MRHMGQMHEHLMCLLKLLLVFGCPSSGALYMLHVGEEKQSASAVSVFVKHRLLAEVGEHSNWITNIGHFCFFLL